MTNPLNPITATAALMIKDAEIEQLKADLKNQRAVLVEHAGRLNNRIKELERIIAGWRDDQCKPVEPETKDSAE